jgi:hypothetical protein
MSHTNERPIPCAALVREWERLHSRHGWPEEESNAASERQCAIERALSETPAETMADMIAKTRVISVMEREGIVRCAGPTTIATSLLEDLERLAGGTA